MCPQITIYNQPIPVKTEIKYLGLHLDQRLIWKIHMNLNLMIKAMHCLYGSKSQLSLENKLILTKPYSNL